jgi:hypothetical protein
MTRTHLVRRGASRNNTWLALQIGVGLALIAVGLTAVKQRRTTTRRRLRPMRDYSGRSGFPMGVEASRGLARNAMIPADMLTPDPLRPFTATPG